MSAAEEWRDLALGTLGKSGYRGGRARRAVIDLLSVQDCCLTAQELHDELRASERRVGIASVYRVLDLLSELRLLQRVDVGDGVVRYEAALPEGDHHHHAICDDCGKVAAFSDSGLERAIDRAAGRSGFHVGRHEITLRGACADCR